MAVEMLAYIKKQSPVHELSGATKLIIFLCWSTAAMLTYDTWILLALLIISFVIFKLSKIKISEIRFVLLFILFFLAIFVRFSTEVGTIAGALGALLAGILVAYWEPLTGGRAVSFQLIFPFALIVGIAVGCTVSLMMRRLSPTPGEG